MNGDNQIPGEEGRLEPQYRQQNVSAFEMLGDNASLAPEYRQQNL